MRAASDGARARAGGGGGGGACAAAGARRTPSSGRPPRASGSRSRHGASSCSEYLGTFGDTASHHRLSACGAPHAWLPMQTGRRRTGLGLLSELDRLLGVFLSENGKECARRCLPPLALVRLAGRAAVVVAAAAAAAAIRARGAGAWAAAAPGAPRGRAAWRAAGRHLEQARRVQRAQVARRGALRGAAGQFFPLRPALQPRPCAAPRRRPARSRVLQTPRLHALDVPGNAGWTRAGTDA